MIDCIVGILFTVFAGWFAWESTLMVDEQKKRRK